MGDVSARMFQFYLELASVHGITAEQLTRGLPEATALMVEKRKWYSWTEHVAMMRRFEQLLGGPEAADEAMRQGAYRRVVRPFNAIVSFLTTARGVYWAGYRWFAPALFRHLRFDYEEVSSSCVRGTVEIPEEYCDCPEFFRMWAMAMRSAPLNIGLPESNVSMELRPRRAVYTIWLPERRRILSRVRSWFRAVFHSADVLDELTRHQREFKEAYESLLAQKEASEAALRANEEKQRALLEGLPDLVVMLRSDGTVTAVNGDRRHRLAALFAALAGGSLMKLDEQLEGAPPALAEQLLEEARKAASTQSQQIIEFSVHTPGQRLYFEWRTSPLEADTVACVVRDTSEKKRLEMQLVLSDRLASLGTLAASVAHEINNPLACVIANLGLAQTTLQRRAAASPTETTSNVLEQAREAAERIRDIVGELRTLSRPDEPSVGPVNLNELLESVLRLTSHQLRHRATLVTELADLPWVKGNEGKLYQVFVNLLINAAQAMPDNNISTNRIRLATRSDGTDVVVEVQDNGRGIPAQVLPRIFDPFFTTKPISEGTGLGLSICHRIVSDLGGSLEVESEVGQGSTFRVRLPKHSEDLAVRGARKPSEWREGTGAPRPPSRASLSAGLNTVRRRVLVIDDNPRVALSVKLLLSQHDVTLASGGMEGVSQFLQGQFDVVLCDLMMPDVDGMELYRRIQAARPDLLRRIVFMTGGAFTPEARQFLESIPNECIEKPFRLEQLERMLERVS